MITASYFTLFLVTVAGTYLYIHFANKVGLHDVPTERSSHEGLVPRGGGAVFLLSWWIFLLVLYSGGYVADRQVLILLASSLIIGLLGFLDDRFGLGVVIRILVHTMVAAGVLFFMEPVEVLDIGFVVITTPWLINSLLVLGIVWSINLFNFMDGTDGIAAVEAIFVLLIGCIFLWQVHGKELAVPGFGLVISLFGFLLWNLPKAKVFMGDVGSASLGLVIAEFAISGQVKHEIPMLIWVILYGVFWFDATITLVRRMTKGERWYAPHRSHAYQRLHHLAGWSHGKLLVWVILLNLVLAVIAYWSFDSGSILIPGLTGLGVLIFSYILVERLAPMYPD